MHSENSDDEDKGVGGALPQGRALKDHAHGDENNQIERRGLTREPFSGQPKKNDESYVVGSRFQGL